MNAGRRLNKSGRCPASRIFFAALWSRSMTKPQAQLNSRSCSSSLCFCPQPEQTWVVGVQQSILTTRLPRLKATHSRMFINCAKPRSLILRPHKRFIEPEVRPVQVQVFKAQRVILVTQRMSQLEVEVAPLVINPNVTTGEVMFPLLLVGTTFNLLRHLSLDAAQTRQIIPIEPRHVDLLPFISCEKRLEAKIKAAALTRAGFLLHRKSFHYLRSISRAVLLYRV